MPHTTTSLPRPGELWLSRPPYLFLTRVRSLSADANRTRIEYELLDDDGVSLSGPIAEVLDPSWWANFQPLVRRGE
ncbi:MAG: hypothetical protein ACJ77Z_05935 [Thermoleophilaceae bacterium]